MRLRSSAALISAAFLAASLAVTTAPVAFATVGPCGTGVLSGPNSGVYTCTYTTTGPDTFTVPSTVSSISVDAIGGKGGRSGLNFFNTQYGNPGFGARVVANSVAVSYGASLTVTVAGNGGDGGLGTSGGSGTSGSAGSGGGGAGGAATASGSKGGGGGGGASSVSSGSTPLVVAGGGGGGGSGPGYVTPHTAVGGSAGNADGSGNAGDTDGLFGDPPNADIMQCNGGGGATVSAAGAGGNSATCGSADGASGSGPATSTAGAGGAGSGSTGNGAGGGAGAGYYGGGGGEGDINGTGSGGGAGSSYPASATITTDSTGTPRVKISWSLPFLPILGAVKDAANNQAWAGTEVDGAQAYFTAALTPVNSVVPTGNVTYYLNSGSSCSGSPLSTQQVTIASGLAPDSNGTGALSAGNYSVLVSYLGDSNYQANADCKTFSVQSAALPDGQGTMTASPTVVSAGAKNRTLTFTYTAANTMTNGVVRLTVPTGWSSPSTTATAAGRSTASAGSLSISSRTIVVSGLNLSNGNTVTIVYGSRTGGGPGASATLTTGAQSWTAEQQTTNSTGSPTALSVSPSVTVMAKDGSGTNVPSVATVTHGSTHRTIVFTFTAATGGMANGSITLKVPAGWSAPSLVANAKGAVTSSMGTVTISSRVITVSGLTLGGGATVTITYGATSGGGVGATAPTTKSTQAWKTKEKSTAAGVLTALTTSPKITIN